MSEKIYLKIDQQRYVKKPKVDIGDVITVYCSDKDMIEKNRTYNACGVYAGQV